MIIAQSAVIGEAVNEALQCFTINNLFGINIFTKPYNGLFVENRVDGAIFRIKVGNQQQGCVCADIYA